MNDKKSKTSQFNMTILVPYVPQWQKDELYRKEVK